MGAGPKPVLAGLLCTCIFLALAIGGARAQSDVISVDFGFVPAKSSYCCGDNFSIEVSVANLMPSGDYEYDSLAYMVRVTNVSVHFYWMPPNEWVWNDVSSESTWLEPDGIGIETYVLNLTVPEDACAQTYSYYFRIEYQVHTAWGDVPYTWGTGITFKDFTVEVQDQPAEDEAAVAVDYFPYFAAVALVLSVGALGAVLYHRRNLGGGTVSAKAVGTVGLLANGEGYPVLRPVPGDQFPIEKGFIYLVKEKRPCVAFSMYNEAVAHGAEGMLISREHPNRLRQVHEFDAKSILWLTRRAGTNHVDPTELSLVSLKISRFVEERDKTVVLIEGAEYLITQNDFETVLRFVNHLHDFVLAHDCAIVVVIDPRVLSTRELALLERSAKVVEPMEAGAEEPAEGEETAET